MKKIFKKTVKILTNSALIAIMMLGAERAIILPFSWAGIGYMALFAAALTIWTVYNSGYDKIYEEGYWSGWEAKKIDGEIYKEINKGEKDEFDIEMETEYARLYIELAGKRTNFCSDNDEYKYNITSIESLDVTTKITFTKI